MHPVTRIYWTHGYGKFRQPKRMRKENTGHILLMHGTDAQKIYWMHGWQSLRIIRTHALHGANSWSVEILARSRDLNTRPLLATLLNPFYNHYYGDIVNWVTCEKHWTTVNTPCIQSLP